MINEKNKENGCKIFCIYFQSNWGEEQEAKDTLKKIAKCGNTEDYFQSTSLDSLYQTFDKISNYIQNKFVLKLN